MNDPMGGIHPESGELQRFADGEIMDPQLARHIESCAVCREEIAAVRRITAVLSLGSKAPDSLAARIQTRRSESVRVTSSRQLSRPRPRIRSFMLPVGLAAAAVLVVFVPRALRKTSVEGAAGIGAKGAMPADSVLFEMVVTEVSIDSMLWWIVAPRSVVELRYVEGRSESPRARRLAERVADLLRAKGVDASAIIMTGEPAQTSRRALPAGAVGITVRSPAPPRP